MYILWINFEALFQILIVFSSLLFKGLRSNILKTVRDMNKSPLKLMHNWIRWIKFYNLIKFVWKIWTIYRFFKSYLFPCVNRKFFTFSGTIAVLKKKILKYFLYFFLKLWSKVLVRGSHFKQLRIYTISKRLQSNLTDCSFIYQC